MPGIPKVKINNARAGDPVTKTVAVVILALRIYYRNLGRRSRKQKIVKISPPREGRNEQDQITNL